jgi:hypothetical protein
MAAIGVFLARRAGAAFARRFVLLVLAASMFPYHLTNFYGEVFNVVLVAFGLLLVTSGRAAAGWAAVVVGVVNVPATLVGMGCVVVQQCLREKRLRHAGALVAAVVLLMIESTIRRGGPLVTGYEHDGQGEVWRSVDPSSGLGGFSHPWLIGALALLLSFGKGLLFYAPGLFLPPRTREAGLPDSLREAHRAWIVFVAGLFLIYPAWWAWSGDWFWGPRFFLFASVPACFTLASWLHAPRGSLRLDALLLFVLALSFWVGISSAVFGLSNMGSCLAEWRTHPAKCIYHPEWSALFRPWFAPSPITPARAALLAYAAAVFAVVAGPRLAAFAAGFVRAASGRVREELTTAGWRV